MYLARITRPLRGSAASGLLGRLLGPQGSTLVNCSCLFLSAVLSVIGFFEIAIQGSPVHLYIAPWFTFAGAQANWGLLFDALSASRLMIVFVVSFVVHLFTSYYRAHDPHLPRFYSYLSLFTGSRGVLLAADNYLMLFLGWEWIGLSSFLLICFWFTRLEAVKSALQALLYNRAGDWRFSRGLFFLIWTASSRDFGTVFAASPVGERNTWNLVCILLLFGAMAKSAQIPRHTWLPNSMEGPTPVSSLLHAATLVTAGVYLLLRSAPLLINAPEAQLAVASIGARTAFFAASTGLVQNDIKRIIAFSTCSQIGYRRAAVGLGIHDLALFHLVNHGFFKALLFLGAGGILHGLTNNQDIRYQGAALGLRPVTYTARLIGSLALIAFPFRSGRYSKELLINISAFSSPIVYLSLIVSAALTAYYSRRLLYRTFFDSPRFVSSVDSVKEVPYTVVGCFAILGLCSIFFGYFTHDAFVGPGSDRLAIPSWNTSGHLESELSHPLLPTVLTMLGLLAYGSGFVLGPNTFIYSFLSARWYLDEAFSALPTYRRSLSGTLRKSLDRGALELVGPHGLSLSISKISNASATQDPVPVTTLATLILAASIFASFDIRAHSVLYIRAALLSFL